VRIYTIRRLDVEKGEVDIDFVLHEGADMPGARFAANAAVGDVVGMTGPGGGSIGEADWYLLAGDETALPAISRIVADLPSHVRAVVRIEIADRDEEQPLVSAAGLDIQWLHRNGGEAGKSTLLEDAVKQGQWPKDALVSLPGRGASTGVFVLSAPVCARTGSWSATSISPSPTGAAALRVIPRAATTADRRPHNT
jgi:NADPH-dependent ferric siderophore reductase